MKQNRLPGEAERRGKDQTVRMRPAHEIPAPTYLSVDAAAAAFGLTGKAIRRHIDRGHLPICHLGRRIFIDRRSLDAMFAAARLPSPSHRGRRRGTPRHRDALARAEHAGAQDSGGVDTRSPGATRARIMEGSSP